MKGMMSMRGMCGVLAGALFLIAGTVCFAAPQPAAPPDVTPATWAAMDAARERVASGDLDGALKTLADYVQRNPQQIPAERLLGDLYYRRGDLPHAEAAYRHILSYAPGDKETHNRLGSVFASENKVDAAIQEFDLSLPGTDSVPDLVELHLRKGDFARYRQEREELVRQYPGDADDILELADLYDAISMPNLAQQYYERVLDTQPRSLLALNGLGLAYTDQHDYTDAVKEFNQCVMWDSYDYPCWTNLGGTYWKMGRLTDARKALEVARRLEPEHHEALVNLGNVMDSQGDWKRAVSLYVQAMTVDPFAPEAYIDLGATYDDHGLYQLAQAALIKGLAVAPKNGRLHFVLGATYQRLGHAADAHNEFEQAADQNIDLDVQALAREELATLQADQAPPAKP